MSAFDQYEKEAWPYTYTGTIHLPSICGGVPASEKVAEAWLRSKLDVKDEIIRDMVAETILERAKLGETITKEEAAAIVDAQQHVNGFKRDPETGRLFIEGRQLKAAIKEAASCCVAAGKIQGRGWGKTNKGILGFLAEHVVVVEDRLYLHHQGGPITTQMVAREDCEFFGVHQRFIHKVLPGRGKISAIHYEEFVEDVDIDFTVKTDYDFEERDWALLWLTGMEQGLGASRSQGFGRYEVTRWEQGAREPIRKDEDDSLPLAA